MKKIVMYLASFLMVGSLLAGGQVVGAEAVNGVDGQIIDNVRTRCSTIKVTIKRVHTNDALVRVNVGQTYSAVSTKLMAKFNSRVSLNKLNGSKLVEITNEFESLRVEFSNNYNKYDTAMTELERVDCSRDPGQFYSKLMVAQNARYTLSQNVKRLNELMVQYRDEVKSLKESLTEQNNG